MEFNVLLVEPNDILRNGLSCALAARRRIQRITEVTDRARALAAVERERFSIAILGAGLAEEERLELLDRFATASSATRCVVIVRSRSESESERALKSRAMGILSDESPAQELWDAVESVQRGTRFLCQRHQQRLVTSARLSNRTDVLARGSLTKREQTILKQISLGGSSREIAANLGLSHRTVNTHRMRMMRKLCVRNTAALVRIAVREGLIEA
jgi:DNA-binding NarL/FixJ family response regulator